MCEKGKCGGQCKETCQNVTRLENKIKTTDFYKKIDTPTNEFEKFHTPAIYQ